MVHAGMSVRIPVFLGLTCTKQRIKCLGLGNNTVTPVNLDPGTSPSEV